MSNDYSQMIASAAAAYGDDPGVLYGIAKRESNFNPGAVNNWDSNARAGTPSKGMFQFIKPTFDAYARNAQAANPAAWRGVKADWMNPQAQALATAWAIKNGHGKAWATYNAALKDAGKLHNLPATLPGPGTSQPAPVGDPTADAILARDTGISPLVLSLLSQDGSGQAAPPASHSTTTGGAAPSIAGLPKGVATFEGTRVAAWIAPVLQWGRAHGWTGHLTSGLRSLADQTRIYNSGVRPAAKPGTSNHEMTAFPGGAVDATLAQQLGNVLADSPYAGLLQWAGAKDPVHLSHPHNGSY